VTRQLNQSSQFASILPPCKNTSPQVINTCYAREPATNIASPSFGSDVAATYDRAIMRASVVHIPLLALKMSTVLTAPVASAQGISNQQRQLKQTLKLASILPPPRIHQPLQSMTSTHATHYRRRKLLRTNNSAAMRLQENFERRLETQLSLPKGVTGAE
jgi:hypothetical protein